VTRRRRTTAVADCGRHFDDTGSVNGEVDNLHLTERHGAIGDVVTEPEQ
jgi:hypothetical protein